MTLAKFNKLNEGCPWLYQPYSYSTKLCKAGSIERFSIAHQEQYKFKELWAGNMMCNRKNCAVLYWLNIKKEKT